MTAGTITLALRSAQSGLLVNQQALNAVANNVANVNSPGYSRKVINMEQRVVSGIGAGVQISSIIRKVDEGLLESLREELSDLSRLESKDSYFARMQELFGSPADNRSISHIINSLTSSLEALAVSPDKSLEQSEVVRWAREVTLKIQDMSNTIQDLRQQADKEIANRIPEVNKLISDIGGFNDKIISQGTVGRDVTDLKDQRDMAIDNLSKLIDIRYFHRNDGDVVVFTAAGRTLVDNIPAVLTHSAASSVTPTTTHAEGDFNGIYVGTAIAANDITSEVRSGALKGLLDLRDDVLVGLQSQLDELAAEIRDSFNQVHNRGVPFPGAQSMTGTRYFIAPTTQTMTQAGTTETKIMLFDASGDQQAVTTLDTIMQSATFGTGADVDGTWTITEVAATIEDWLQANGAATASVSVAADGVFSLSLNNTSLYVAFRDETAAANGSTHQDGSISFDANADTFADETVSGFSNFLGLNDFFVDGLTDNIRESNIMSSTFTASAATLSFSDSGGLIGTQAITSGQNLATIASNITTNVTNITASVVPDGDGFRLRISHDSGKNLEVTQANGNTFLTDVGMHSADVRISNSLSVRSDIINSPGNISRGAPQWDSAKGASGEYFMSVGDDTIIKALAEAFTGSNGFDAAGGLTIQTVSFDQYAASIVSHNASLGSTNATQMGDQRALTESLQSKSDTERGVNIDEEMANLILYEQAYSAAARLISVIQSMFDALDRAVGR
jgi:flagellar hook-associated protein 1